MSPSVAPEPEGMPRHDDRRRALAESALRTLGELGYARASLREIAQNSEFSHGVVHYYFRDKLDLIVYCAQYYESMCADRYDDLVDGATSAEGLCDDFASRLAESIAQDASVHRLWYDLRSQSMFEDPLREAVYGVDRTLEGVVWRVLTAYAELQGRSVAVTPRTAYGLLDGLFQQALLAHLAGQDDALERLARQVRGLLPQLLLVDQDEG
ncbi:MAG TPA: TetR/AcrR family transcriptional regulator [Nocardioides sp.]|uniref:TetR/AcrR family transcriptional regulator n=1 Tax=Nocardioides sp. TaxID=35761 RepID=UPI002ED93705